MKRTLSILIFAVGFALGAIIDPIASAGTGDKNRNDPRKPKFTLSPAGSIPTEFGELITVTTTPTGRTLVFQNTDNEIHLVDLHGSQVNPLVRVIERHY